MYLYLMMTTLFLALAGLIALDAALTSYTLLPWFNGLRWLRVHFITLGALSETLFGVLPLVVAMRAGLPRPRTRRDIWLTFNLGLLTLIAAIPIVNPALIVTGGTLIFVATLLLLHQLAQLRAAAAPAAGVPLGDAGRKFYIAGLSYFLVGILVGSGLWLGWAAWLRIAVPLEVHIHANNWGLMALVFAGLIIDTYPAWAQRPFPAPRAVTPIFWLLTLGALALILGPWFKSELFTVPGIVLFLIGTGWLLTLVVRPLRGARALWAQPGIWHLLSGYFWILAPVLVAPLILLQVPGFPGAGIEQNAPQALVYGWVLQFGYAMLGFFAQRTLRPTQPPQLGGNWFSLAAVHLGGALLWASIFVTDRQALLHGSAYLLWALSLGPIVWQLWSLLRDGLAGLPGEAA